MIGVFARRCPRGRIFFRILGLWKRVSFIDPFFVVCFVCLCDFETALGLYEQLALQDPNILEFVGLDEFPKLIDPKQA